jgi:predicted house-cleaning NTP pyrophosphatase (Maf/HAM1 superfamily)
MRILRREGVEFEAIEALVDDAAEAPEGVVEQNAMRIAQLKAHSVVETFAPRCKGKFILAADTICEMDGHAVGKPRAAKRAYGALYETQTLFQNGTHAQYASDHQ